MAVFNQLPQADIRQRFTHRGWFAFCPVYLAEVGPDGVSVEERHGVPAWVLDLAQAFMAAAIFLLTVIDPNYVPQWGVFITAEIEHE
jgi:peptidoglycan/LPS O-acetylase OafA/YrhL